MLGHLSIGVRDIERAGRFYDAVMAPVGWVRLWSEATGVGYGPAAGNDKLALFHRDGAHPPGPGFHVCFNCTTDAAVDAFHMAALANGGADDGAPGPRSHFGPDYYACFEFDPEGRKLVALHEASWDRS